jgi:hypothetical protein
MKSLTWLLWKLLEEAIKRNNREKVSYLLFIAVQHTSLGNNTYLRVGLKLKE